MRPSLARPAQRGVAVLAAAALGLGLTACGGQGSAPSQAAHGSRSGERASLAASRLSGTKVTKLLVFMVENHSLGQMRAQMPFTYRLGRRYAYATDYHGISHPSLPNYLAIAGGSTFGVTDDQAPSAHPVRGRSVFGQALAHGRTAKVYADGMPGNCAQTDGGDHYAVRHNPWTYFVGERAACNKYDVPLGALTTDVSNGNLPNAGMVVPNTVHDAHDASLAAADAWLKAEVNMVRQGRDWTSGRLAIVITGDEDDDHHGNRVLTVVASRSTPHRVVKKRLNHYSLTGLYDDVLGVGLLRHAKTAPSMRRAFGVPVR